MRSFPKKIHVTFDNFTVFRDNTQQWMDPDEHSALPELMETDADLWDNYLRARAAHEAACAAILYRLRYPDGTPQGEVQRQQAVFEQIYAAYCDWTNGKELPDNPEQREEIHTHYMEKIHAIMRKEVGR